MDLTSQDVPPCKMTLCECAGEMSTIMAMVIAFAFSQVRTSCLVLLSAECRHLRRRCCCRLSYTRQAKEMKADVIKEMGLQLSDLFTGRSLGYFALASWACYC